MSQMPRIYIILSVALVVFGLGMVSRPARASTNVTACGVLNIASETYILQNDVSAEGTCFAIAAHNITLDLNGHTVTYGTAAGNNRYGVALPVGYANDISRTWFPGLPDEAFGGARYAIIMNGAITQGAGDGSNCHAIFARSGAGSTIHSITATVHGADTDNFLFDYANNLNIYNNTLVNNSTTVSDRHQGREVVGSLNDSGNTKIHGNTIIGGPQWGIRIYQGAVGVTGIEVYGNTISQNARVANPYAIGAQADNMKIYDNIITPQNGRGIHVTKDSIEIYNNSITVKEGPNAEYAGGWSHGIKLENATNAHVHDNVVTALAGGGYGAAYALDMTVRANSNNELYNNTLSATTTDSSQIAAAVHFVGVDPNNGSDIHHNIIRSNNYHVYADWDSGSGVLFRSNTFEQTGTSVNYHFLRFNTGPIPSEDITFLDSTLGSGVALTDVSYRTAGATIGYQIEQYLRIQVNTQGGGGIAGAHVSVRNHAGTVVATGTTSETGLALFAIPTHIYSGKPPVETDYTPHTVSVSAADRDPGSYVVTLDTSKLVTFNLAASGTGSPSLTQETPYDAPGVPGAREGIDGGSSVGSGARAKVIASVNQSFFAYNVVLRSGYHVASGNVLGDQRAEIIVGTTSGMSPHVRVFDNTGSLLSQFFAYDSRLRYGVTVAACNVVGDATAEIVTAQDRGGWPLVRIYDGYGKKIHAGFYVLDGKFTGGVNVACGDVNGDGLGEIVIAARRGGGPHVMVYSGAGRLMANFMAYSKTFRGGISIATADTDDDGAEEVITGPQWGASHIQVFKVQSGTGRRMSPGFFSFNRNYRGGVSVAGVDTNGDGTKEIVVGVGNDATPFVKVYSAREQWRNEFYAYATNFLGGLQLAGGDVDGDGADELITIPRGRGAPQVRIINLD